MTREEAINFGEMWLDMNEDSPNSRTYAFFERALEVLKVEHCEDAVSREAVLNIIEKHQSMWDIAYSCVENLPPVIPTIPDCEDCVSREAVLDALHVEGRPTKRFDYVIDVRNDIMTLQPVTPKQKTGKWIKHNTGHSIYYDCSLCGCVAPCTETADSYLWKLSNFCPDCGAKMEGEIK